MGVIVLTEYVLSKQQYDKFEWEIMIKSTEASANKRIVLQMGFVNETDMKKSAIPIEFYFNHSQENTQVKAYLCYLSSYDPVHRCNLYGRGSFMGDAIHVEEMTKDDMIRLNSRVKLLFDFVK